MRLAAMILLLLFCRETATGAGALYVGWATVDITPDKPVALVGQLHKRISQKVRDPLTATALAVETRGEFTRAFTLASQTEPTNAEVCLGVDAPGFLRLFMERILSR